MMGDTILKYAYLGENAQDHIMQHLPSVYISNSQTRESTQLVDTGYNNNTKNIHKNQQYEGMLSILWKQHSI